MPTAFSAAGKYPKKPNENNSPYEVVQYKYTTIVENSFNNCHFFHTVVAEIAPAAARMDWARRRFTVRRS